MNAEDYGYVTSQVIEGISHLKKLGLQPIRIRLGVLSLQAVKASSLAFSSLSFSDLSGLSNCEFMGLPVVEATGEGDAWLVSVEQQDATEGDRQ